MVSLLLMKYVGLPGHFGCQWRAWCPRFPFIILMLALQVGFLLCLGSIICQTLEHFYSTKFY